MRRLIPEGPGGGGGRGAAISVAGRTPADDETNWDAADLDLEFRGKSWRMLVVTVHVCY